ncbi:MAG: hypothetical protein R3F42_08950 [Pseudomonadota bacterium]
MKQVAVFLLSTITLVHGVMAGEPAGTLPETWYSIAPWATQPPVDLARRLAAANRAVNAAQGVVTSYSGMVQAQADIQNQRMAMQTELDAYYLSQRAAQESAASGRRQAELEALDQTPQMPVSGKTPTVPVDGIGYSPSPDQAREVGELFFSQTRFSHGWARSEYRRLDSKVPK